MTVVASIKGCCLLAFCRLLVEASVEGSDTEVTRLGRKAESGFCFNIHIDSLGNGVAVFVGNRQINLIATCFSEGVSWLGFSGSTSITEVPGERERLTRSVYCGTVESDFATGVEALTRYGNFSRQREITGAHAVDNNVIDFPLGCIRNGVVIVESNTDVVSNESAQINVT